MEATKLLQNKKEKYYFSFFISVIFLLSLLFEYSNYKKLTDEEIFQTNAIVLNSYQKPNYQVLKLQTKNFTTFTSTSKDIIFNKLDRIEIFLITKDISFYKYLKGFYLKSFNIQKIPYKKNTKDKIYNYIQTQHQDKQIASIYTALFLAIPIDNNLRDTFANYGISHLIAISGFHLGLISVILYFLLGVIYKPLHKRYFPYRNKRFDILIVVSILLFIYLLLTNIAPSLLRAFSMFIIGIFLLRNNIKLLSFNTLFLAVIFIIALFPKLLFSLSLWFSVAGVFYIYLFIKYFKNMNRYLQFVLFNIWIYLAINPIVHFFFPTTAFEQLYSPILTVLFSLFYPFVALLHILNIGGLLDSMILYILNFDIYSFDVITPLWFFSIYLIISFLSIINKKYFYLLHILFIGFNLYLYIKI